MALLCSNGLIVNFVIYIYIYIYIYIFISSLLALFLHFIYMPVSGQHCHVLVGRLRSRDDDIQGYD